MPALTGSRASTRSGGCGAAAQPAEGTGCALLIETRAAIGNLRRSAKVEGIDCLTIARSICPPSWAYPGT